MTRRKIQILVAALTASLLLAGALVWFQPWKLWVDTRVDEALPVTVAADVATTAPASVTVPSIPRSSSSSPSSQAPTSVSTAGPTSSTNAPAPETAPAPAPASMPMTESVPVIESSAPAPVEPASPPEPAGPVVLGSGSLISHEHETSGTAALVQLADGSRVLTLENLSTSDGPDVRVWLSPAPVIPGEAGWYTFADAPYIDLGAMKGNLGNQVYEIPAEVDLAAYPNVSLWCQRFSVSFGAAELLA